jgi:hypothetical protein
VGKSHDKPYDDKTIHLDHDMLSYVAADLKVGLPKTVSGFTGYLIIVVRMKQNVKIFTYLLRTEAVDEYLIWWMRMAHTQHYPRKIKQLRIDGGTLRTNAVIAECKRTGTILIPNTRAAHKQNPLAETYINIIEMGTRASAAKSNSPETWWDFAHICVVNAIGTVPGIRALKASRYKADGSRNKRPPTPNEEWKMLEAPTL